MSKTPQDYYNEAIALCESSEYAQAITKFDQAIANHPQAPTKYYYDRAKAHFKLALYKKAIVDFNYILLQEPENAYFLSERAVAHHLNGNNELAINDLDKAAEIEPNKPFRYSSRAFIKEKMGDLKGAIADYERCIALDPDDAVAHNNKGLIEEKLGYIALSKKSFSKADSLDKPSNNDEKMPQSSHIENTQKDEQPKPNSGQFFKTVKALISDKNERTEFALFLKKLVKK